MESRVHSLPPILIKQLQESRVIPFVGAGLSVSAGLPAWEQLLRDLLESGDCGSFLSARPHIEQAIDSREFELAAEAIAQALGDRFADALRTVLRRPGIAPTVIHHLIASVAWPAIITTNYDDLLSKSITTDLKKLTWQDDADLGSVLRHGDPHLLFAHGCIDRPESIVITGAQYRECLRHPPYRTYFKTICSQYTLLFLGFSFSDRDVGWTLEDLRHEFGQSEVPHFALMPASVGTLRAQNLKDNFNIQILPYAVENGSHSDIERLMGSIIDCCPADRIIDKATGLRELSALTDARHSLSAEEYITKFRETCVNAFRLGYERTACMALQGALNTVKDELPLLSRVQETLHLARLLTEDGQYQSAGRQLHSLSDVPLLNEIPEAMMCEFLEAWFEAGVANYQIDTARAAFSKAESISCSAEILSSMETRLKLFNFLHGDPSVVAVAAREGQA
jgi:SIR2-like domain